MRNYKKLYEKELLDNHTKKYIHIPFSWGFIGRLLALLGSITLTILNSILLFSVGKAHKVWTLIFSTTPETEYHSFSQLIVLYPIIGEYILIILSFICLFALIKGGFNKIKSYKDNGLIFGLFFGLKYGLKYGLMFGLMLGLMLELMLGLMFGLMHGLFFGLMYGLFFGLFGEFK